VPINPPNPFFNPFGGPNPFQMFGQNNQQQPQAQPAAAGPTGAQTGTNTQQPNPNIPPFVFPPFPFMPFMAPPPMPPPNLRSLSPEELRRMEGNERQNVEARIQCLRNIQVCAVIFFDAVDNMMSQQMLHLSGVVHRFLFVFQVTLLFLTRHNKCHCFYSLTY
jgi:hypothetical protein